MDRKEKLKMRHVNSRTPVFQSTPKSSPNYIGCDAKLIPRIKQYVESNNINISKEKELTWAIDRVVEHLQKSYQEYRRKKMSAFKKSVSNGLKVIRAENFKGDEMDVVPPSFENMDDIDSDFSFENNYVEYEDANSANNTLREMYSRKLQTPQSNNSTADVTKQNKESEKSKKGNTKKRKADSDDVKEADAAIKAKIRKKNNILPQQSTVTFEAIAGIEDCIVEICWAILHLKHPVFSKIIPSPTRGILLRGPPGCGKTTLADAIAGELGLPFFKMGGTELVSGVSGESEGNIRELFDAAVACAPSIIFLDEIDSIASKRDNAQREMEKRIVSELLTSIDKLNSKDADNQVLVIGATNRPDNLDSALRRPGRFDLEITLGVPNKEARIKILEVLSHNVNNLSPNVDLNEIVEITPGFTGADMKRLFLISSLKAIERRGLSLPETQLSEGQIQDNKFKSREYIMRLFKQTEITEEYIKDIFIETVDIKVAAKELKPAAIRENAVTIPNVTWDDIGALEAVKKELQFLIKMPVMFPKQFESLKMESTGILLCGPPGCGKTTLAKAIANESQINFISVKGAELLNMYLGESERSLRKVFQRASICSPCVLFFDEIDALCPKRSGVGDNGAGSRVVSTMLTELDGIEELKDIFVIGATNFPNALDEALLRHGRFGKLLYVGFPNPEERVKILIAITKFGANSIISPDVSLNKVGEDLRCDGFTGSDLLKLYYEARKIALEEFVESYVPAAEQTVIVTQSCFEKAFDKVRPSVSKMDRRRYENVNKTYCDNYNSKKAMSMDIAELREEELNSGEGSFNENKLTVNLGPQSCDSIKCNENDTNLVLQIQQFINESVSDKDITLDDLVDHLVHSFSDYQKFQKKGINRINFRKKVLKGVNSIQSCNIVIKKHGDKC